MATTETLSPPDVARDLAGPRRPAAGAGGCSSRPSSAGPSGDSFVKLQPPHPGPQPGHVRRRDRRGVDHGPVLPGPRPRRPAGQQRVRRPGHRLAVVHGPVRQLRRGASPKAGARPRPRRCARPARRPSPTSASTTARSSSVPSTATEGRRPGRGQPGPGDPRRRGRRRGHRLGRRVGHHRRIGAGHPRVRRRPLGRHRRHPGALRRDRRADHVQAGRDASSTG